MRRDEVIRVLQQHREELVGKFGVKSLALFGSVARDDARDGSDIDLLIEFDERPVGYFHLGRTHEYLRKLLGVHRLDLVLRRALLKELKPSILRDAIDVVN
jgi:predicted nucleotidyltransferase